MLSCYYHGILTTLCPITAGNIYKCVIHDVAKGRNWAYWGEAEIPGRRRACTIRHVVGFESDGVNLTSSFTLNVTTLSSVAANIFLVFVPVCWSVCIQALELELVSLERTQRKYKEILFSDYKRVEDGVTDVDKYHSREIMLMHACLVKKLFVSNPNRLNTQVLKCPRICLLCLGYVNKSIC